MAGDPSVIPQYPQYPQYQTPPYQPPPRKSLAWLWWLLGVGAVLAMGFIVLAAALVASDLAPTRTIAGRMTLLEGYEKFPRLDAAGQQSASGCYGRGGYDDIRGGARVTVKNEKGTLIGTGSLESGTWTNLGGGTTGCVFPFTVADVKDADFYQVEVSHRGGLTYSKADLEAKGWVVEASLG